MRPSSPNRTTPEAPRPALGLTHPATAVMRRLLVLLALSACQSSPQGPVAEAGALEDGDLQLASGEFFDAFDVRAREGQWIRVEVVAEGFDPYLILRSPTEEQSEVDDSDEADTTRTEMAVRAGESGRWEVLVTSFAPGATGSYRLTTEVTDAPPPGHGGNADQGPTIEA